VTIVFDERKRTKTKRIVINIRDACVIVFDRDIQRLVLDLTRRMRFYNMERENVEPIKEKIMGIISFGPK
jgi:hypothetical protein